MNFFNLPQSTIVNRNIPKNAFDEFTNTKQKQALTNLISKIQWLNKLSPDTVNINPGEIDEIHIFEIKLKLPEKINDILTLINKAIPYHIIFFVTHENDGYISTSKKHPHPTNENIAVIDWTFETNWFSVQESDFKLILKRDLDFVYKEFCAQLTGVSQEQDITLEAIIEHQRKVQELEKEISKLESQISRSKQFNKTVELNIELRKKREELERIINKSTDK